MTIIFLTDNVATLQLVNFTAEFKDAVEEHALSSFEELSSDFRILQDV